MSLLEVQLLVGVPDRLAVPRHVAVVTVARILKNVSPAQWSRLHQVDTVGTLPVPILNVGFPSKCIFDFHGKSKI